MIGKLTKTTISVIAVDAVRVQTSVAPVATDITSATTNSDWSFVEPGIAIIIACSPCYRPAIDCIWPTKSFRKLTAYSKRGSKRGHQAHKRIRDGRQGILATAEAQRAASSGDESVEMAGRVAEITFPEHALQGEEIGVQRTFTVTLGKDYNSNDQEASDVRWIGRMA